MPLASHPPFMPMNIPIAPTLMLNAMVHPPKNNNGPGTSVTNANATMVKTGIMNMAPAIVSICPLMSLFPHDRDVMGRRAGVTGQLGPQWMASGEPHTHSGAVLEVASAPQGGASSLGSLPWSWVA